MLCIKITTNGVIKEGTTSFREINQIFEQLLDPRKKEITLGGYTERKADILSIDVFERVDKKHKSENLE